VLAFFNQLPDESKIRDAIRRGLFDWLAQARQCMSLDPKLSLYLSDEFRPEMDLATASFSGVDESELSKPAALGSTFDVVSAT
jgi:hypothetical protein